MNNQTDPPLVEKVSRNWRTIVDQVADAATHAGREPNEITIVGVSKYVDAATTRILFESGCNVLGESRPQALWDKASTLNDVDCQWHFIGNLQRNKVRRTLPLVSLLHSIDSQRLAQSISQTAIDLGIVSDGLLEVNVSGDAGKQGLQPADVGKTLEQISNLPGLRIEGLMAMAGLNSEPLTVEHEFASLRQLRDKLVEEHGQEGLTLRYLSMGMSGDFQLAIKHGATHVRIGSRLFD